MPDTTERRSFHSYEYLCIKRFQEDVLAKQENTNEETYELWSFVKKLLETMKDLHVSKASGLQGIFWKFRFDKVSFNRNRSGTYQNGNT